MAKSENRDIRKTTAFRLDKDVINIIRNGAETADVTMSAYVETAIKAFNNIRVSEIKPIKRGRYRDKK